MQPLPPPKRQGREEVSDCPEKGVKVSSLGFDHGPKSSGSSSTYMYFLPQGSGEFCPMCRAQADAVMRADRRAASRAIDRIFAEMEPALLPLLEMHPCIEKHIHGDEDNGEDASGPRAGCAAVKEESEEKRVRYDEKNLESNFNKLRQEERERFDMSALKRVELGLSLRRSGRVRFDLRNLEEVRFELSKWSRRSSRSWVNC